MSFAGGEPAVAGAGLAVVELDRVSKAYAGKVAVRDLSLRIEAGSMYGLLGPNGAGKTSSIRMMVGITMPDTGSVRLFGRGFARELLPRIGYLPEERGLYKKMKVLDQIVFLGEVRGLEAGTARKRALAWCERLQITDALEKKTDELSKGMQQKIQFISTVLHDPQFLIMDEPFSGLDPVNTVLMEDALLGLKREGRTILFSTHRMDQVEKLCDTICLINGGEAVLSGGMREVKNRFPRNRVLLEFEGDERVLHGAPVTDATVNVVCHGGTAEMTLRAGADAQHLLRGLVERLRIHRFEVMEPSLEEIFIETVKGGTA